MHSFKPAVLEGLVSHEISRSIGAIHEARGKQELFEQQKPEVLNSLQQVAIIESTESSNRLEGITAPQKVLEQIIQSGQPMDTSDRSEGEIAGYRQVLGTLHDSAEDISLSTNVILQFHRDLMQFTPEGGGYWKKTPNDITIKLPDGTSSLRAETTPPFLVEPQMTDLVDGYNAWLDQGKVDPLILIALFVLDFLCIHPFSDGNGRMARLLTVLLLYRQNYLMVRYVSLERIIESSKEGYYETLNRSDRGWHEGNHAPMPWVEYFLSVLVRAASEFTSKVEKISSIHGMKKALVLSAVEEMTAPFSISELGRKCPSVGRDTLRTNLSQLKQQGYLEVIGRGRYAKWRKK